MMLAAFIFVGIVLILTLLLGLKIVMPLIEDVLAVQKQTLDLATNINLALDDVRSNVQKLNARIEELLAQGQGATPEQLQELFDLGSATNANLTEALGEAKEASGAPAEPPPTEPPAEPTLPPEEVASAGTGKTIGKA